MTSTSCSGRTARGRRGDRRVGGGDGGRGGAGGGAVTPARPWRFVAAYRAERPRPIPEGDLSRLTLQALQLIARDWGYQTVTLYPRKAEYVAALTWLRCSRANIGGDA